MTLTGANPSCLLTGITSNGKSLPVTGRALASAKEERKRYLPKLSSTNGSQVRSAELV